MLKTQDLSIVRKLVLAYNDVSLKIVLLVPSMSWNLRYSILELPVDPTWMGRSTLALDIITECAILSTEDLYSCIWEISFERMS